MNRYAITDDTGEISQIYQSTGRFIAVDEDVDDMSHYIDTSTWLAVPKENIEVEVSTVGLTAILKGVPSGVTVEANSVSALSDGDVIELMFDLPGTYSIELYGNFKYLPVTIEVTVNET